MMPGQVVPYGTLPARNMVQQHRNPSHSNIYKRYNNRNVCLLCIFDVEDRHSSLTCLFRKVNQQTTFTCKNVQQFIAAGYDLCTKGMHKNGAPIRLNDVMVWGRESVNST